MADGNDRDPRMSERTARWLEDVRHIPAELAASVGFVTSSDGNVGMTFYRDGQPIFRKWRYETPGRKREKSYKIEWLIPEGPERALSWWNDPLLDEPLLKPTTPLIVTEGEFDASSYLAVGMGALSVPNGTTDKPGEGDVIPSEDTRFGYLWRGSKLDPRIDRYARIILSTDNDHAGRILRDELAIRLGRKRCWYVTYPTDVIDELGRPAKDANEVLVHFGPDAVVDLIANAKPIVPDRLVQFADVVVEPRVPHGPGWKGLEPHLKFVRPELCVFTGPPGAGKALALDTEVPTPRGWTTMGAIEVGDVVYDETGRPCRVTAVSEVRSDRECFRVRFNDGTEIVADADHQWMTHSEAARDGARSAAKRPAELQPRGLDQSHKRIWPSVVTTRQIKNTLVCRGKRNHAIPLCDPIQGMRSVLPVHPYTLGVWLGDGRSADGGATLVDDEIIEELKCAGETLRPWAHGQNFGIAGLQPLLRSMGLLSNKHIPAVYLRADIDSRRKLLHGLMDTDGFCCSKSRRCEITLTNERLARDTHELICGLGFMATFRVGDATIDGRFISKKYRIGFIAGSEPVFTLPRKLARQQIERERRQSHRLIVAVEDVPSVPVRCIQVDSPSHLFLVTRQFIPTHNSQFALNVHMNLAHYHGWRTAILQFEDNPERNRGDLLRYRRYRLGREASEADVTSWVNEMFRVVLPDENLDELQDVAWLEAMVDEAVTRHGCKAILIDPWNEVEHFWSKGQTEAQYLNEAVRRLKKLARRHRVLVSIVAHPDKASGQEDDIARWSLYSMAGGAVWNNKADHGVVVLRNPDDPTETWLKVAKSKDHAVMGVPGIVRMRFNPLAANYEFVAAGTGL